MVLTAHGALEQDALSLPTHLKIVMSSQKAEFLNAPDNPIDARDTSVTVRLLSQEKKALERRAIWHIKTTRSDGKTSSLDFLENKKRCSCINDDNMRHFLRNYFFQDLANNFCTQPKKPSARLNKIRVKKDVSKICDRNRIWLFINAKDTEKETDSGTVLLEWNGNVLVGRPRTKKFPRKNRAHAL